MTFQVSTSEVSSSSSANPSFLGSLGLRPFPGANATGQWTTANTRDVSKIGGRMEWMEVVGTDDKDPSSQSRSASASHPIPSPPQQPDDLSSRAC